MWITGRELAEYWFFRFHPVEVETVACSYFTSGASPEWLWPAVYYVTLAYYWVYNAAGAISSFTVDASGRHLLVGRWQGDGQEVGDDEAYELVRVDLTSSGRPSARPAAASHSDEPGGRSGRVVWRGEREISGLAW